MRPGRSHFRSDLESRGSGAPRRRQLVALARRDHHACEAWRASCAFARARRARLSALHRGDFWPGAALPSPAFPPESASSELLAARSIVPGGRGPEPPEPAGASRSRGTPLPAPPQVCLRKAPLDEPGCESDYRIGNMGSIHFYCSEHIFAVWIAELPKTGARLAGPAAAPKTSAAAVGMRARSLFRDQRGPEGDPPPPPPIRLRD